MRALAWLLVSGSIAVAASCGLPGATGSGAGAGGAGATSSAASAAGGAIGGGASSTSQATTTTTGNGGAGGIAGAGGSGGTQRTSGGGSPTGGGGSGACDPASPGVCCPDAACGHNCCYTRGGGLDCQSGMCNGAGVFKFLCDDSRDCMTFGQICCSTFDGADYTADFKCVPPAMCMPHPAGAGTHEVCDYGGDRVCAGGGTCMQGTILGGKHGYCAL